MMKSRPTSNILTVTTKWVTDDLAIKEINGKYGLFKKGVKTPILPMVWGHILKRPGTANHFWVHEVTNEFCGIYDADSQEWLIEPVHNEIYGMSGKKPCFEVWQQKKSGVHDITTNSVKWK